MHWSHRASGWKTTYLLLFCNPYIHILLYIAKYKIIWNQLYNTINFRQNISIYQSSNRFLMDRLDQHGDNWRNIQLPIPLDEPRNTPITAKPDKNQHQKGGAGSTTKVWYWIQPEQLHSLVSTDWMLWHAILHIQFMQYSSLKCSYWKVHKCSKSWEPPQNSRCQHTRFSFLGGRRIQFIYCSS